MSPLNGQNFTVVIQLIFWKFVYIYNLPNLHNILFLKHGEKKKKKNPGCWEYFLIYAVIKLDIH